MLGNGTNHENISSEHSLKISVISDIHVNPDFSGGLDILRKFCRNQKVRDSDVVVFLGDIFDLMVYDFDSYLDIYSEALEEIRGLTDHGAHIYFVEGNHDFNIRSVLEKSLGREQFFYFSEGLNLNISDKIFSFHHGDSIEIENYFYKIYRYIIKSRFLKNVYKYLVGFDHTWSFGNFLLGRSHERHLKYSNNYDSEKVKRKFRVSAQKFFFENKTSSFLICGHSHIKDNYVFDGKRYLNNGFAQKEKTFLYFNGNEFEFVSL